MDVTITWKSVVGNHQQVPSLLRKMCGEWKPVNLFVKRLVSDGYSMFIHFHSSRRHHRKGFRAVYNSLIRKTEGKRWSGQLIVTFK